jgi:hypothetical protein
LATDGALRGLLPTFALHAPASTFAAPLQRCNTTERRVLGRWTEKSEVIELPEVSGDERTAACGLADTGHMASANSTTE